MKLDLNALKRAHDSIRNVLGGQYIDSALVGSLYILGEGNDMDIVCLVKGLGDARAAVTDSEFKYTGEDSGEEDEFDTYRHQDVNLMLTVDRDFFVDFQVAAEVCKQLVLWQIPVTKDVRIKLHRIIMNEENAA